MEKKNINPIHAPLPYPIYPIGYEGSLTQTEAMGQFQAKLNELIDSYNALIGTFPNVVQTEGKSTTDVMSQAATTESLSKKLNYSDVLNATGSSATKPISQLAATAGINSKVAYTDVVNELGSSTSYPPSQKLLSDEIAKLAEVTYDRIPKSDITQTTGNSTTKVMSQAATTEAIADAVAPLNTYETVNFYKVSGDNTYKCSHSYDNIFNNLGNNRRRYYFYNGTLNDGKRCEVFPSSHSISTNTLYFDGIVESSHMTGADGTTDAASFVAITMTGTLIECKLSNIGVTNTDSNDTNLSPSVKLANKNYVKYSDIENENITLSPKKTISSAYASQNYSYGYRTGYFTPTYDAATQQIAFKGGRTGDANISSIEYTINCTIPEIVGTENTPFIKFVIGAVATITTPIRIKQGINHIQIKKCVSNRNMWTISNISSDGSQEAVISNTQLPTSVSYSNWIMGLSLNMPTGFGVAVIGGYSY